MAGARPERGRSRRATTGPHMRKRAREMDMRRRIERIHVTVCAATAESWALVLHCWSNLCRLLNDSVRGLQGRQTLTWAAQIENRNPRNTFTFSCNRTTLWAINVYCIRVVERTLHVEDLMCTWVDSAADTSHGCFEGPQCAGMEENFTLLMYVKKRWQRHSPATLILEST